MVEPVRGLEDPDEPAHADPRLLRRSIAAPHVKKCSGSMGRPRWRRWSSRTRGRKSLQVEAAIGRAPQTAVVEADVKDVGLAGHAVEGAPAPARVATVFPRHCDDRLPVAGTAGRPRIPSQEVIASGWCTHRVPVIVNSMSGVWDECMEATAIPAALLVPRSIGRPRRSVFRRGTETGHFRKIRAQRKRRLQ
jgi:hypothetical protein